jgi:N-dimethylarginine dimethylaminohydrolase
MDWFRANGFDVREPIATNEGEGDMLLVGDTIYAGTGFRTDVAVASAGVLTQHVEDAVVDVVHARSLCGFRARSTPFAHE